MYHLEFLPYITPEFPACQGFEVESFDSEGEARDRMFDLVSSDLVENCHLYREGRWNLLHEYTDED